jgi:hypothetical protein
MEEHEQNDESIFQDEPNEEAAAPVVFHFSVAGSVFRGTSEMGRGTAHTFRREIFLVCPCFVVVGGRPWKRHVECVRRSRPVTIYYYAA